VGIFFEEDIRQIITTDKINWNQFSNSVVFVTGATGIIGGAIVSVLSAANTFHNLSMQIIAHGQNLAKGQQLTEKYDIKFVRGDIRNPLPITDITNHIDYIFHCASITQSADMVSKPIDVMTIAVEGTKNVLNLAKEQQCKSFVYLSSMEVYGQIFGEIRESSLGYLDLSSPRTSYPESKRFCESLCIAYGKQYDAPVKIARLSLTFGAGTANDPTNRRVPLQFARKAISKEDIILHTKGESVINCCYTADVIMGLIIILLNGKNGEAYNIANPAATVTVKEMANTVAQVLGNGKSSVVINIPEDAEKYGYAPATKIHLNVDKLKALGWIPKYGLDEMYQRMIADW